MKFIFGLLLGLIVIPVGAYLYFTTGRAPVATSDSDMPFEAFLAKKALHARISKEAPQKVPIEVSEANYLAGAQLYKDHCAVCHGLPLAQKTAIATGMYPQPPQLFNGKGVTDDEPGESYWKIANGIRLTGMPGFSKSLSQTQMWQVAILLAYANKLPTSAKTALVAAPNATSAAPAAAPSPVFPPAQ